jgi:hypothetical protein
MKQNTFRPLSAADVVHGHKSAAADEMRRTRSLPTGWAQQQVETIVHNGGE